MSIIIGLLLLWVVLSVLGFVIKGLLWLAFVGLGLVVLTIIIGWVRGRAKR